MVTLHNKTLAKVTAGGVTRVRFYYGADDNQWIELDVSPPAQPGDSIRVPELNITPANMLRRRTLIAR